MTDYIGDELPPKIIYVTRGTDTKFTIRRRHPTTGDPLDWTGDVYLSVDIDPTSPTRVDAVVTAADAVVRLYAATVCDRVSNATTWQAAWLEPDTPDDRPKALMVGVFERQDGRLPDD